MESLFKSRTTGMKSSLGSTQLVFDLCARDNAILAALKAKSPQLSDIIELLRIQIPLPRNAATNTEGHFYRLPTHNRSFCYSLATNAAIFDAPALVFKGTEPLLSDYEALVNWMLQAPLRKSSRVMADHFPLAEGKIPGALSLKEANREVEIALSIQAKHLLYYGELANLPTPVLVHTISNQKRDECLNVLRRKLSPPAFDRIELAISDGLAIYIYYYPRAPIRTNYWGGIASTQLTSYVQNALNEEAAILGWVKLIIRLLYLGYLPYSVRNDGLGACMDFGNATIDGGFCDLDSIVPIDTSPDDEFFRESIIQSFAILQRTFRYMLGLSNADLYPSIDEFACNEYVQHLIRNAIASEARPGLSLDDRFIRLISPRSIADFKLCIARRKRFSWYMPPRTG